jgi:integrase
MGVTVKERDDDPGAWWLYVNHQGRRKAKRVGVGPKAKKAADLAAVQIRARLAQGDVTIFTETPAPQRMTFEQYARKWLAETITPHRKTRTADYYEQVLETHLLPTFGQTALGSIKPAHVRAFIAEKMGGKACEKHEGVTAGCDTCVRALAKNTVKNAVATFRAILYQAQVDELIASNPAARFGKLFDLRQDKRKDVAVLEPTQIARVLQAAAKWYPDHELAVTTLFYTGVREGELLGLQWDDFDFQRGTVELRRTVSLGRGERRLIVNTPKSGKIRTVDLPSPLPARFKDLKSIRQAEAAVQGGSLSAWVFPAETEPEKPLNDAWLRDRLWRPLLEKAEVRHIRVHDARHTYASLMLRRGVPPGYVSRQLGHSSIQVTVDLYGHFIPGADRHHVEALAADIETRRAQPDATPAQHDSAAQTAHRV